MTSESRGVGEIGVTGSAGAVAKAVWPWTGNPGVVSNQDRGSPDQTADMNCIPWRQGSRARVPAWQDTRGLSHGGGSASSGATGSGVNVPLKNAAAKTVNVNICAGPLQDGPARYVVVTGPYVLIRSVTEK